jgi:hypothetical protein
MTEDAKKLATEKNLDDTADLVGEYAGALLPALEIVKKAAKKPLSPKQRDDLAMQIKAALWTYATAKRSRWFTLRKIARPLASVIKQLDHQPNITAVLATLGAPIPFTLTGQDHESVRRATEQNHQAMARYTNLMHDLKAIAGNLPPPPPKRSKGKKEDVVLSRLVNALASIWETWTGTEFTRDWHKENDKKKKDKWVPATVAMHFVLEIVKLVDPARVGALRKTTEKVRAKRLQAAPSKRATTSRL